MNTKIGTSFGLALVLAIGAIAAMFAMGVFSAAEVRASDGVLNPTPASTVHNPTFTPASLRVNSGTSWNVTFGVSGALAPGVGTMYIAFPSGTVLPATIDKSRISAGRAGFLFPLTTDPTISGTTVTITAPATMNAGVGITLGTNDIAVNSAVTVSFSQLAGILNPAKSGAAGSTALNTAGKVKTSAQGTYVNVTTALSFNATVSLSATSAAEDDTVTVTVAGFTPGLKVSLSGLSGTVVSGSATVGDDRKAVIAGTMKSLTGVVIATDTATTPITATSASISIKPTLTATATGKRQDSITLIGKNFYVGSNVLAVSNIEFGSGTLTALNSTSVFPKLHVDRDADGVLDDFAITIKIPSSATTGVNQIKVTDVGGLSATATVTVESSLITIEPTSGPPGTKIIISGGGFPKSRAASTDNKITISPDWNSSGVLTPLTTTVTGLFTNSAGALPGSDSITIPATAEKTVVTVTVTIKGLDTLNATGAAKFTVGTRVLTVTPTSGPMGTKILVEGTKFSAAGTVNANAITVDAIAGKHDAIVMTSDGDVPSTSVTVPALVTLGSVTVKLTENTSGLIGTATFEVTQPTLETDVAEATMGTDINVTGSGWVPSTSVTITLAGTTADLTQVTTSGADGSIDLIVRMPSNTGTGPQTVTFTASDGTSVGNTSVAVNVSVPKAKVELSGATAVVGDTVTATMTGFPPQSGLSTLTIGGADVRSTGAVETSNIRGELEVDFVVPGVIGSQIVSVTIGGKDVSTSMSVTAAPVAAVADTTAPADIFADVIANDDNLVRVWRFSNADQEWAFYDPRPEFEGKTSLEKSGAGDIVWIKVVNDQTFQGQTLVAGWNLIVLK